MSPQLHELWLEYAVAAFGKQRNFAALLGRHEWQWSHDGQLLLCRETQPDDVLSYTTQPLGTESRMSATWIWIWADERADVAPPLMRCVQQLRAIGIEQGIPEFTTGELPLDEVNGHMVSLVAVGLLGSSAYYCGTSLGGAGFVLIDEPVFNLSDAGPDAAQVAYVFREAMASLPVDDGYRAFGAYLRHLNWQVESNEREVIGRSGLEVVQVRFDEAGAVKEIDTEGKNSGP